MEKVILEKKGDCTQAFILYEDGQLAGEMVVSISGKQIMAQHTGLEPAFRNRGLGVKLVDGMADYARAHEMRVAVLCPYTYNQFSRHPEKYTDIWNRSIRPLNA